MATITFNDNIFVKEALQHLVSALAPIKIFTRDLSNTTSQKGNAVLVPLISNVTATTFNQSYINTGGTIASVTVNLNQHRIATVSVTDAQMMNSSAAMFDNFAMQLAKGLGKLVIQDVWSSILTTNGFACVTTLASTSWAKATVNAFSLALDNNDVEGDNRNLVINMTQNDKLLADTNISHAYLFGGSEAIRTGTIPQLLGFNVYKSNIIPTNSISLVAFACHPDAIAVAMRTLDPVVPSGAYENLQAVQDPESGISFCWRRLYDPNTGTHHFNAECLFGYTVALTRNLVLSTTATV